MSAEVQRRMFEKFYQGDASRSSQGNGLGLSLAKRIVDLHGGRIDVSSAEGRGTAFTVTLPVREADGPGTGKTPLKPGRSAAARIAKTRTAAGPCARGPGAAAQGRNAPAALSGQQHDKRKGATYMEENDEYRPVGGGAEILRFARAASGDVMDEQRRLLEAMVGYKDLRMMYSCALKEVRTEV